MIKLKYSSFVKVAFELVHHPGRDEFVNFIFTVLKKSQSSPFRTMNLHFFVFFCTVIILQHRFCDFGISLNQVAMNPNEPDFVLLISVKISYDLPDPNIKCSLKNSHDFLRPLLVLKNDFSFKNENLE